MPQFDEKHVKLCGGLVVWDGVTQPETVQQGAQAGKLKYSLKCVFEPTNPDIEIYDQLTQRALQESQWRGQLPAGGRMPIGTVQAGEFNGQFQGWRVISFKTTLKAPDVYDEQGGIVDAMQLGSLIYTGQKVDVLAHCYAYDAAGNKGVSAGLDAFAIIASANAPRVDIGTGGVNTSAAFGGQASTPAGPAAGPASPAAGPQPPIGGGPAPAHDMLPAATVLKYQTPDGAWWTREQLISVGYQDAQLAALPQQQMPA